MQLLCQDDEDFSSGNNNGWIFEFVFPLEVTSSSKLPSALLPQKGECLSLALVQQIILVKHL